MVSTPPPKIMGGLDNFSPTILGRHYGFFVTLGGPNPLRGLIDMIGGVC